MHVQWWDSLMQQCDGSNHSYKAEFILEYDTSCDKATEPLTSSGWSKSGGYRYLNQCKPVGSSSRRHWASWVGREELRPHHPSIPVTVPSDELHTPWYSENKVKCSLFCFRVERFFQFPCCTHRNVTCSFHMTGNSSSSNLNCKFVNKYKILR